MTSKHKQGLEVRIPLVDLVVDSVVFQVLKGFRINLEGVEDNKVVSATSSKNLRNFSGVAVHRVAGVKDQGLVLSKAKTS